jgi:hypothetical protein
MNELKKRISVEKIDSNDLCWELIIENSSIEIITLMEELIIISFGKIMNIQSSLNLDRTFDGIQNHCYEHNISSKFHPFFNFHLLVKLNIISYN